MKFMGPHGDRGGVLTGTVFDRAAPTYGRVGPDFFSDLGELLVDRSNVPVGSKVIDVGAGTGAVTQFAAVQVGPEGSVLAIDIAPEMLTRLRQRLDARSPVSVATAVMDAGRLGVRSDLFDAVLSGIALQSMPDPPPLWRRCAGWCVRGAGSGSRSPPGGGGKRTPGGSGMPTSFVNSM